MTDAVQVQLMGYLLVQDHRLQDLAISGIHRWHDLDVIDALVILLQEQHNARAIFGPVPVPLRAYWLAERCQECVPIVFECWSSRYGNPSCLRDLPVYWLSRDRMLSWERTL